VRGHRDVDSLKDTWADTTTPHGRLMLTVLGGLAEFERELIPRPQSQTKPQRGIPAARGGKWSAVQVARVLEMARSPFDASAVAVA
jgi:DNA invertase Pin-like site-specific DNA recombinase